MNATLAIVGSHPRTREAFDFSRTDCDVWLFNEAISNKDNTWAKRADMIFQMHVPAIWRNPTNRNDPHHYDWLKTQSECDIMMQDEYEDVPRSIRYPIEVIKEMVGSGAHFLTSSVALALAYAIWSRQYRRIEVYGVAMETNTEYQFQREGVAFWIGFAKGRGIDLQFADSTFDAPIYGYEGKVSVGYEEFGRRVAELEPGKQELTEQFHVQAAATRRALAAYVEDAGKKTENELRDAIGALAQAVERLGMYDGALAENRRYQAKADAMRAAADGEHVFSRQEFEAGLKRLTDESKKAEHATIAIDSRLAIIAQNVRQAARGSRKRQTYSNMLATEIDNFIKASNEKSVLLGAAAENARYMAYLDKHIRAAGGSKSEAVLLEGMRNEQMVVAQ